MLEYKLGTIEASEALIKDLYVDLRSKVNAWSEITKQTPQARMGYIGQHLVSVVTGYPGGKSGARGYDLVISPKEHGEIKTCYRVDQLGACCKCGGVVSSLENECASCGSKEIARKDDSKWLISIRTEEEFSKILTPSYYYFVLFEFNDLSDTANSDIIASIWEVDPKNKGFAYCMVDYYLNIKNNAPFNMWPYALKFSLTNPKLIYRSIISPSGIINTEIFPTLNNGYIDEIRPLSTYANATTITADHIKRVIERIDSTVRITGMSKRKLLETLEYLRTANSIPNLQLCDMLAEEIYLPAIRYKKSQIPITIKALFSDLAD